MSCTSWYTWWLKKQKPAKPDGERQKAPEAIPVTEVCPLTISRLLWRLDSQNKPEFALAYELIPMIFIGLPRPYVLPKEFLLEAWVYSDGVIVVELIADERVVMTQSFRKDSGESS